MKRKIRPLELVMLAAPVILLAVFWWPSGSDRAVPKKPKSLWTRVFGANYFQRNAQRASCQSNLKQIGLGFMQYVQDYDAGNGTFPSINGTPLPFNSTYGWADTIRPYIRNEELFQCPAEEYESSKNPRARDYTDYWMNSRLSQFTFEKLDEPVWTILAGDGNDGKDQTDARYSIRELPEVWLRTEKSPVRRHSDGANYLFADSHVKFVRYDRDELKKTFHFSIKSLVEQPKQKSRR